MHVAFLEFIAHSAPAADRLGRRERPLPGVDRRGDDAALDAAAGRAEQDRMPEIVAMQEYQEKQARLFSLLALAMGVNVCFPEYRGYGASSGIPALGAMLPDGASIVAALGIPLDRIVAFGRSLGSVYAIELAKRLPRLAGLILESGIADILESLQALVGEVDKLSCTDEELLAEIKTYFDLRAALQGYHGRILVLHAGKDRLIDPSHAERLYAWAGGKDKKLVVFPVGNHITILCANYVQYVAEVKAFLERAAVVTGGMAPKNR